MIPVKTAVVGCGKISDIYFENMINRFDSLDVVACCAQHLENAQRKAKEYGIEAQTYDEILADPTIEMIVNLTPAKAHYDILRRGLEAGKHVYTEKIMTLELEEARELCLLADRQGVYLGSSPDTFLGAAYQTAKKAVADGLIGDVTSFTITANRNSSILASVFADTIYPGGGMGLNYSVYYLTGLFSILGPAVSVAGITKNPRPVRQNILPESPQFGQTIVFETETQMFGYLELASGIAGTMHLSGESILQDTGGITLYGSQGVLCLPCPNFFGGEVKLLKPGLDYKSKCVEEILPLLFEFEDDTRGIGPAEMALAIREGRPNRASKELAFHVEEVIDALSRSNNDGCKKQILSTFEIPALMNPK